MTGTKTGGLGRNLQTKQTRDIMTTNFKDGVEPDPVEWQEDNWHPYGMHSFTFKKVKFYLI